MFGQPAQRTARFVAAFDSDCFTCGGEIFEGDEAGYMPGDGGASCPECIGEDDE